MELILAEWAQWYAARGIRIFPGVTKDGRRQPGVREFYDVASCDADVVAGWWERWPDAWIAVAAGPTNNLVVIDQDTKHGIDGIAAWRAKRPGQYEFRGPQARTASGGLHDWYRWEQWDKLNVRNSASDIAPGVDVRAWHGFVWAPTSGGREWITEPPESLGWIPELPEWAHGLVAPKKARTKAVGGSSLTELLENPPAQEGEGRNVWLTKVAGHYAVQHSSDPQAYEFHVWQANALLPEPMDEDEVRRTMDSILRSELAKDPEGEYPAMWTDAEVGEAFGKTLEGRWLYCRQLGGWMRWDGTRWKLDPGERVHEEFRRWVLDLSGRLYNEQGLSAATKAATKYREKPKIDAAVTISRRLDGVAAVAESFDQHPYLLNCTNGVVDLRTGTLGGHSPALRLTKVTGCAYLPEATHADVESTLLAVSDEVRPWLQRLLGSAMVGKVIDDLVVVLDGSGANGKSTLLQAVASACGDYANPASSRLLVSKSSFEEHPTLIADLAGQRLVYVEETPEGGALKIEQLKYLSGGGTLKARFIGKDWFQFEASLQIVVATNHRPAVNASDYAAWRRLALVPFTRTYRKVHEAGPNDLVADPGLRIRVDEQAQREATLAWIVAGAVTWHAEGIGSSTEVDRATAEWRLSEDVIASFWDTALVPDAGKYVQASVLYATYAEWCSHAGRPASSLKEFMKRFTGHELYRQYGVDRKTSHHQTQYHGIALAPLQQRLDGPS